MLPQVIFDAGSPDHVKALYLTAFAPDLGLAAVLPHQVLFLVSAWNVLELNLVLRSLLLSLWKPG